MTVHTPPQGEFKGLVNKGTHRFTGFIASGGEGQVYHLNSYGPGGEPLAGKVYGNSLTRSKIKKLSHMIALGTPEVRAISAWPIDLLATRRNQVVGFAMPLVSGGTPLHLLRTPKTRLARMPNLSYPQLVQVAENVAGAVASLHNVGIVVGDINGQNFLVSAKGTIQAIDCDSMQVGTKRDWASGVGVEEYIAPELQGRSLKGVIRTTNHDAFALAVLLFELLVLGRHPFGGHAGMTVPDAIARRAHVFSGRKPHPTVFDITGIKPADLLSQDLVQQFKIAFGSMSRPSASDWHDALQRYRRQLVPCSKNGNHAYPAGAKECPWCAMEKKKLPQLFRHKAPRPQPVKKPASPPPKKQPQTTAPPAQPPVTTTAATAPAPAAPVRKFSLAGRVVAAVSWSFRMTFRLVSWLLWSFLKLLLTPVSTTRALTLKLISAVIEAIGIFIQAIAVSIHLTIQSVVNRIVRMATKVGFMILAVLAVVWHLIYVIATILFNISLMLGTLYGVLWILREFFGSVFY